MDYEIEHYPYRVEPKRRYSSGNPGEVSVKATVQTIPAEQEFTIQ